MIFFLTTYHTLYLKLILFHAQVTNGLSLMLGWTWGNLSEDEETQFKMFDAAELVEGKPCSERYPEPSYPEPSCRIFDWQPKEDTMSLDFEHTEL